jgi:hypothetical protein
MNPETENFDQLRRLLALKRHEQPPPGYFNNFSAQVIARIKAGERAEDTFSVGRWLWEGAWLQRLWSAIETKPALAGAFGVLVCGLLVSGIIYSDSSVQHTVDFSVPVPPSDDRLVSNDRPPGLPATGIQTVKTELSSSSGILPAVQSRGASIFDDIQKPEIQRLVWQVPGN